ncbi:MAG: hypothetical protein U0Q11_11825 [Vicinamibacterales bacterium]
MLKQSLAASLIVTGLVASPMLSSRVAAQAAKPAAPATASTSTSVHFEGCLFTEPALTATMPLVVPAGVPQTWVLTSVKVIAGQLKDADVAKQVYLLNKVDQTQAQAFYGKRVGVVGHVGAGATHPTLEVISMREISGGCPVLPNLPQ